MGENGGTKAQDDRRLARRHPFAGGRAFVRMPDDGGESRREPVKILDYSISGVGFFADRRVDLPMNTHLLLEIGEKAIAMRIRRCATPEGSRLTRYGAEFCGSSHQILEHFAAHLRRPPTETAVPSRPRLFNVADDNLADLPSPSGEPLSEVPAFDPPSVPCAPVDATDDGSAPPTSREPKGQRTIAATTPSVEAGGEPSPIRLRPRPRQHREDHVAALRKKLGRNDDLTMSVGSRGAAGMAPIDGHVGGAALTLETSHAVVFNRTSDRRDILIAYDLNPKHLSMLSEAKIHCSDGLCVPVAKHGTLLLAGVQPDEHRWLAVTALSIVAAPKTKIPIRFVGLVGEHVETEFTLGFNVTSLPKVIRKNLRMHQEVHRRLLARSRDAGSRSEPLDDTDLRRGLSDDLDPARYIEFVRLNRKPLKRLARTFWRDRDDTLLLHDLFDEVRTLTGESDAVALSVAHTTLLGRLDAVLVADAGSPMANPASAEPIFGVEWAGTY